MLIRSHKRLRVATLPLVAVVACSGDDANKHRYMSPPPRPVVRVPSSSRSGVVEPALGSVPSAWIASVREGATGAPASLESLREPVELLAVLSPGRGRPSGRAARIELVLRGAQDTVLAVPVTPPAPVVITQLFRLSLGGPGDLRPGRYEASVRVVDSAGEVLAGSVPLALVVRP